MGSWRDNDALAEATRLWRERDWPMIERGEFATVSPPQRGTPSKEIRQLNEIAARYFDITAADIEGMGRTEDFYRARCICWHLLRDRWGWSSARIGKAYGRDHSSVLNGWHRYHDFCEVLGGYRKTAEKVRQEWESLGV